MEVTVMNEVLTAISTVGFPIVACGVLFWQNSKMSDAINNNTIILTKLCEKLED